PQRRHTGSRAGYRRRERKGSARISSAASRLREKLGESLASIQKFDKPVQEATTSSLEALKAYSQGDELLVSEREKLSISRAYYWMVLLLRGLPIWVN